MVLFLHLALISGLTTGFTSGLSLGAARPEIVLASGDRERRVEDRPPARRGLEGRRGARRTEPPNAAGKVGRGPSNRLPSALGQLEIFTPVDGHRDSPGD